MQPGTYDITLIKGTKWERTFYWKDSLGAARPTTGYTVVAHYNGDGDDDPLSVSADGLGADGAMHVLVTPVQIGGFDWEEGEWYLNVNPPGEDPVRLLQGTVRVRD